MLPALRKRQLLERVHALTDRLIRNGVTRAELKPVQNVLFLPGLPWADRLEQARRLWDKLPESFVGARSKQSRPRLAQVREMYRQVFQERFTEEELRFLLGWVTRLVHTHELEAKRERQAANHSD